MSTEVQVSMSLLVQTINDAFAEPEPIEHIYARGRWYEQLPAKSQVTITESAPAWPILKKLIDQNWTVPGCSMEFIYRGEGEQDLIVIKKVPLFDPLSQF
jgi:hypothetical protein